MGGLRAGGVEADHNVRIDWNTQGFYDLRRDDTLVTLLESKAEEIADRAMSMGSGTYAIGSRQGRKNPQGRWHASVVTADAEAMVDNSRHNTLLKALD